MIFDEKTDSYTLILKTPDSNIEILEGKMNIKRFIKDSEAPIDFDFDEPVYGMKQLHRDFDNLFVQMFRKDEEQQTTTEDQYVRRIIVYIDQSGQRFDLCFSETESPYLKDFL